MGDAGTVRLEPVSFAVERDGLRLAGESVGEGPPIVLLHGLTATRRYVVHGSKVLPREGFRVVSYDARGHGESGPAPEGAGHTFPEMVGDLVAVLDSVEHDRPVVLAGHSMGAHTAVAYALERPERIAGLVLAGPAYMAVQDEEVLAAWERLAVALEEGGVDGFVEAAVAGFDPAWRETVARFTRQRMNQHRDLQAVARALREVPRSAPFGAISELEFLDVPALVVASHDLADPRHPFAVAAAWAERLPRARLVSEPEGESPLAWQGGRFSREISSFCREPAVAERLAGSSGV